MMEFLYFPQDRTEYIPAVIILILVLLGAGLAVYLIKKQSEKQEHKLKEFEARVMERLEEQESGDDVDADVDRESGQASEVKKSGGATPDEKKSEDER